MDGLILSYNTRGGTDVVSCPCRFALDENAAPNAAKMAKTRPGGSGPTYGEMSLSQLLLTV